MQSLERVPATDRPQLAAIDGGPLSSIAAAPPITVVIVDELLLVAESLRASLGRHEDIQVVAVAGTCAGAVEAVARHQPDILLLEQHLPDGLGTNSLTELSEICPQMKVLMVTADGGDDLLLRAITAGAAGVILKTDRAVTLLQGIRAAARGDAVISASDLRRMMPRFAGRARLGHDLTAREREVLSLLAAGRSTSAVAGSLFVAPATARNHIQSIMGKLGAHTRLEAVAIAVRQRIVTAA